MTAIVAHRGLHRDLRENTLEAFEAARAVGADGVEFDVRRTVNGELVVHHDPRVGSLVIAEHAASELASYVPSLAAALETTAGLLVNVEVKNLQERDEPTYDQSGDFARSVIAAVAASPSASEIIYSSFDLATCVVLAESSRPVGWLLDVTDDPRTSLERAARAGLAGVNPYVGIVDADLVTRAHALGLAVNVWTVNAPTDLAAMFALGVDAVITDDPETAIAVRGRSASGNESPRIGDGGQTS